MQLPRLALQNYQFVLVLIFIALSTGLLSFFSMPRSEDPALQFPVYVVTAVYPGTSPQDMEDLVVEPLEDALNELEDLTEIQTEIREGLAIIRVEGEFGQDTEAQFDDVRRQVAEVRGELPADLYSLETRQVKPLDVSILQLALVGEHTPTASLIDQAEALERRLEQVAGVRTVTLAGEPEEEVRIALDFEAMAQRQLSLNQVLQVIRSQHANIPGGDLRAGTRSFSLKTSGGYVSVEALRETVVAAQGQQLVYLDDIAEVYHTQADDRYLARFNGQRAIFVNVTQKAGKNILDIDADLMTAVADFRTTLPANIQLETAFRQGPAVADRVNDFFANLFQGILLVGAVILIFLGLRNALIVVTVIPAAIIMAIWMLDLSGFGLQQISIAGLVIALGLLVDNGIVVVENIYRYLREGFSPREAAVKGTSEVGWAIVSSTLTTVLAFFPMTQLGGGTGEFLKTLPLIVIFALVASLLLALAFTPLLAGRLMKPLVVERLSRIDRAVQWVITGPYRNSLNWALRRPLAIVLIALLSLGGSFALFPYVGVSFFPTADKPLLVVNIDTPEGSDLTTTDAAARYVEEVLDQMPLVASYATNIGHGNPQIYYNVIPKNYQATHAQLLVNLKTWEPGSFYGLIDTLRDRFGGYPGARITVQELKNGPPYEAPIAIKVIGPDLGVIRELSGEVARRMAATEGTLDVEDPLALARTNLKAGIRQDQAGMLGVPLVDIDLAMRTALTGQELGVMSLPDGSEYPMVARLDYGRSGEARMSDFSRIALPSLSGAQVPLPQLVSLYFEAAPARIDHFDLERTATVTAGLRDGYEASTVTPQLIASLETMNWPEGYRYYVAGEYETQQESFGDLGQMLIVAIFGIFAVLILQFRSFRQPFVVLSAIPLALSGSILALFLTGYSFSFFAFVGFTSLAGIVVNTSIILVDYTNQLRATGLGLREALVQAAETRFTPILLTTLTTIGGLLPLTLTGSQLWAPLGWTIIGGMVSSTFLTLMMVPVLYQWLSPRQPEEAVA